MSGLLRFLLGGAVGAVLGFFISRSRSRTAESTFVQSRPVEETPSSTADVAAPTETPISSVMNQECAAEEMPSEAVPTEEQAEVTLGFEVPEERPASRGPVISAEELRTRIEESRRRIREELEHPFGIETSETSGPGLQPDEPGSESELHAESEQEQYDDVGQPDLWESPAPTLEVLPADESFFEEMGVRIEHAGIPQHIEEPLNPLSEEETPKETPLRPTPAELESSLSYDAMRARIEETRNRLKAKASGAMAGQDADLAPETSEVLLSSLGSADSEEEVAARIDSLLREGEE